MKFVVILAALLTCSCFLVADDDSHHHEDMNEVQVGTVHFPSSCAAAVQKPIERGVAMLHSFWYEEAEKQFEQIEKEDPQCAIAHWGVAMSLWHQLWNRPDKPVLERGGAELKAGRALHTTPREHDYIVALSAFYAHPSRSYQRRVTAYSKQTAKVSKRNPEDHGIDVLRAKHRRHLITIRATRIATRRRRCLRNCLPKSRTIPA